MKDKSKSLLAISNADYKRDLAELVSAIERKDEAALESRKKNGFGAALYKRAVGPGKSVRARTLKEPIK